MAIMLEFIRDGKNMICLLCILGKTIVSHQGSFQLQLSRTIGDDPYRKITVRNWADVELFVYAKHLFIEQAALVHEEAAVVD